MARTGKRFTEEQIFGILKEAAAAKSGVPKHRGLALGGGVAAGGGAAEGGGAPG